MTAIRDQVLMTVFMTIVTLGAVFFVGPIMLQQERDEAALKERGVDAVAVVQRTWSTPGSARSAPSYHAQFSFERSSAASPIIDEAYVTAGEYGDLLIGARVPIVYDPQQPSLAQLNFSDKVRRRNPQVENTLWALLLFVILALAWAANVMFFRDALRERRRLAAALRP